MIRHKTLVDMYGNPLEWTAGTKAVLLLCFTLLLHTQYFLWAYYQVSNYAPALNQTYVNTQYINDNLVYLNSILLMTLGILCLTVVLRKYYPNSEIHEHVATQYFALTMLMGGYAIGTLTMATGVVLAGAPVLGFILFNRRAVLGALIISIICHSVVSASSSLSIIPYAPVVERFQETDGALSRFWLEAMYYFVTPHLIAITVMAYHVLSRWRQRENEVRLLSLTDPLTLLSNRRSILSSLNQEYERSQRHGTSFSLLLVDLDHFKHVNDTWGHPAGDQVLVETAKALKDSVRLNDHVGRYGGEEFLVILPDTDTDGAYQLAERCRQRLEGLVINIPDAPTLKITASIGLFCNEIDRSTTAGQMLHHADVALYKAKESGRNQVTCYQHAMSTASES